MANGRRHRMKHIVVIAKSESSANNLCSMAKILFPESEIHLVINNDKIKKVHMTCENFVNSKN